VLLVTALIVGLAFGAAALIGLAKGHGVLGIFAANHLTELVWGATAMLLIAFSRLPRVGLNHPCGPGTVSSRGTDSNFLHRSTRQAQEQIQWLTST
jgi:hypothetical protein